MHYAGRRAIISTRDAASTIAFEGLDSYQDAGARAAGLLLGFAAAAVALAFFAGLLLADRVQSSAPSSPPHPVAQGLQRLPARVAEGEDVYAVYFVSSEGERSLLLAALRAANRSAYPIDPSTIYIVADSESETDAIAQVLEISQIRQGQGLAAPTIQDLRLR